MLSLWPQTGEDIKFSSQLKSGVSRRLSLRRRRCCRWMQHKLSRSFQMCPVGCDLGTPAELFSTTAVIGRPDSVSYTAWSTALPRTQVLNGDVFGSRDAILFLQLNQPDYRRDNDPTTAPGFDIRRFGDRSPSRSTIEPSEETDKFNFDADDREPRLAEGLTIGSAIGSRAHSIGNTSGSNKADAERIRRISSSTGKQQFNVPHSVNMSWPLFSAFKRARFSAVPSTETAAVRR